MRGLESDTEEDEILEEREAVPLCIRIPSARGLFKVLEVDLQQQQFLTLSILECS